jgi:hypothetical protein
MAGKKHYFGVGGGTRQFLRLVTEDGKVSFLNFVSHSIFIHVPHIFFPAMHACFAHFYNGRLEKNMCTYDTMGTDVLCFPVTLHVYSKCAC